MRPIDRKGVWLRFVIKIQPEGLGGLVLATIYHGRQPLWRDAVFIVDRPEIFIEDFCSCQAQVFGSDVENVSAIRKHLRRAFLGRRTRG